MTVAASLADRADRTTDSVETLGVTIAPGEMQLTRMPNSANCVAHTLVMWMTAALLAE